MPMMTSQILKYEFHKNAKARRLENETLSFL